LAIFESGEPVASQSEVLADGTIGGEKLLGVPGGFKPLHPPLALAGRLMGVFGTIVQVPVRAMFDTREHLSLRGTVALELVRDDHPWDILAALEELPKELLGRCFVAAALHQDI
jgi:hypothetical protein